MKLSGPKLTLLTAGLLLSTLEASFGAIGDGLLNYWNFEGNLDDSAGSAVGSTSTSSDNGTPANAALVTFEAAGPLGQFGRFAKSHVVVPNSPDILAAGESLSISAWFRVTSFDAEWQALIAHGEGSDYRIARRTLDSVVAYAGGTGDIPGSALGPPVNDEAWHHVVAISEATVSARIWVDGALVAEGAAPTLTNNGSGNLWIGGNPDTGTGRDWNGDIDDVAMWGRALTDAEIAEIHTKGLAGTPLSGLLVANTLPLIGPATLTGQTVAVTFTDSATSQVDVTKPRSMTIDSVPVTPTTFTKVGLVTTLSYTSPTPYPPGAELTVQVTAATTNNTPVSGTRAVRVPSVSNIIGGGKWDTEHVWTRGSPQMSLGAAEEALNDPSVFPPEDSIITKTQYIHFHDDVGPPLFAAESTPYPLWDPVNGGSGFGNREDFAIRARGQINIVNAGKCWFVCNSDDGFVLRIDGTDVGTAPDRARANTLMFADLTAGPHDVEFVHWERAGGAGVSLYVYKGVSDSDPPIDEEAFELLEPWLNPSDTDGDGMLDSYEIANELNPAVNDAALDKDGDTITNLVESQRGSRANKADTDDDGLNDNIETNTGTFVGPANTGTNPLVADTDGDGLRDGPETNTGTFVSATNTGSNPFNKDTDTDGVTDGGEVSLGSNPVVAGPPPTIIEGGGTWTTEHVWTRGNPTLTGGGAEAVLDDPSVFPPEDSITTQTTYIHFHDNTAPPWFVAESTPYPLWDPANGGPGFADREDFALRSRGTIKLTKAGMVWFACNSDDGFFLRVDGTEIGTAPDRGRSDTIMSADLTAGLHEVELVHWERAGGAGVSLLIFRATTTTPPVTVTSDTWQLLETAPTAPPTTILAITAFTYTPATSLVNLTFTSSVGSNYALEYTTGFQPAGAPTSSAKWNVVPSHASIAGAAGTTSITPLNVNTLVTPGGELPNSTQVYLRIRKL